MKFPIWFSAALISANIATATAEPQSDWLTLSPAEEWVVAQVTAGDIANLHTAVNADYTRKFTEEKDRKVSAHFLEALLTGTLPGIKLHRNGVRIVGAIIDEPMDMSNAKIPWEVWLDHCQFSRAAIFLRANFEGMVRFENSTFKADANFNGLKVGEFAVFSGVMFEGPVNFGGADIASNFEAIGAQFKNEEQSASFNGMKVGDTAFFREAVFAGTADFILADIGANFEAQKVQFNNKYQGAYFYGMRVGQIALFKNAVFEGRVEFDAANVGANFEADQAQFRNEAETVRLVMKCGRQGVFRDVTFAGPVSFEDSSFLDLVIDDKKTGAPPIPRLDLSRSSIKRHLSIRKISIQDLVAPWLHVEGPADFTDITIEHSADLSGADFATLDLSRSVWPKDGSDGGAFHMQGMNYKYLHADSDESKSHEALLKLANQSSYTADVYSNLQEFLLRQGYASDADKAFIAGKRRERSERLHGFSWAGSLLLDWLVGYGRHPERAGYVCLAIVALGCILFPSRKMKLRDPEEGTKSEDIRPQYNRLWYSLGLFLPVVDLKTSELWKPTNEHAFLQFYVRIHILMGWIFVPIFLAAISGLIK